MIAAFVSRHAVPTYYALTFVISWAGILLTLGADGFFITGATMAVAGARVCSLARASQASF